MFYYLLIWFSFVASVSFYFLLWFWQSIYGTVDYIRSLFSKYFSGSYGIIVLSTVLIYIILVVVQTFQNPTLKFIDEIYSCLVIPVMQFLFSIAWTVPRGVWEFMVFRYNDYISLLHECAVTMVNSFIHLPSPLFVSFYTGIAEGLYYFVQCFSFAPFFVPSMQIPYNVNQFLFGIWGSQFCFYEGLLLLLTQSMDAALLRNECTACRMDPNATCAIRIIANETIPPFSPTLIYNETTMECPGCVSLDCKFVTCGIRLLSNMSLVFQAAFEINVTELIDETIEPACCVATEWYKIPFYIFIGLFTDCYTFSEAPGLFQDYIQRLADCWVELFMIWSGDTVPNIFIYVFAIIFDFAEDVIDSYLNLVACSGLTASCFNSWPENCIVNSSAIPTQGLFTCFETFGDCVVEGDGPIEKNPLLDVEPFTTMFQETLPDIARIFDAVGCTLQPARQCMFGPDPLPLVHALPNCPSASVTNWDRRVVCLMNCFTFTVPLFAPVSSTVVASINFLNSRISDIVNFINTFYDQIRDFCRGISGFVGRSCPLPDTSIPTMQKEGSTQYQFKKGNYTDWTGFLEHHNVNINTTCGSILYKATDEFPKQEDDLPYYVLFWTCIGLFSSGLEYENRYPERIDMNRLMNFNTMFGEIVEVISCISSESQERMEMEFRNQLYNFKTEIKTNYDDFFGDKLNYTLQPTQFPMRQEHFDEWSVMVRDSHPTISTVMMGVAETLNRVEPVYITKKWVEFHSTLKQLDRKLRSHKMADKLKNLDGVTVGQLLPNDNRAIAIFQNQIAELDKSIEDIKDPLEYRLVQLEIEKTKQQMKLDFGSMIINSIKSIWDRKLMQLEMKRRIRRRNYETSIERYDSMVYSKPIVLTHSMILEKKQEVARMWKDFQTFITSASGVKKWIDPDSHLIKTILYSEVMKDFSFVRTTHMAKTYLAEPRHYENMTKFLSGQIEYTIDDGFMSLSEYNDKIAKRDNTSFHLYSVFTGTYNPRRPQKIKLGLVPAEIKEGGYSGYWARWKKTVAEDKIKLMEKLGIDPDSEEGRNFRISSTNPALNNFVFTALEWLFNNVIGAIAKLFFKVVIHLDLKKIVVDFVDLFDPLDILEELGDRLLNWIEYLITCNIPEDYDGTNNYKVACFPFMYENLMDWAVPVGQGNRWFPLQLGIIPVELIEAECVNTFNGNPHLFSYKQSNNCGNNDGYPRPRCDSVPQCDWCERDFLTCATLDFNTPFDSFAFGTGVISTLLQTFYTGQIPVQPVEQFMIFFLLMTTGLGTTQLIIAPYFVIPFLMIAYAISNLAQSLNFLLGNGEPGGFPYGLVYIVIFILYLVFTPFLPTTLPSSIVVLFGWGLSITWLINVIVPFNGIKESLRINEWLAIMFEFLENTPQPLLPIPWQSFVTSFRRFDYSIMPVPYADIFCFFFTFSNFVIFFIGAFLMIDMINFMYVIFYPFFILLAGIITAVSNLIKDFTYYTSRLKVDDLDDQQGTFKEVQQKRFNDIRRQIRSTKQKLAKVFTPRINNFASIDDTWLMKKLFEEE